MKKNLLKMSALVVFMTFLFGVANAQRQSSSLVSTGSQNSPKACSGSITCLDNYTPSGTGILNFQLTFTSPDDEYLDGLSMTFPAGMTPIVTGTSDPMTPNNGCAPPASGTLNPIVGQTITWGEIVTPTACGWSIPGTYVISVGVTIGAITGAQTVSYTVYGDGYGATPHTFTGNITVNEAVAHDLGVTAVTPTFVLSGGTVTPTVSIKNFGANDEATWSVTLTDGGTYTSTKASLSTITVGSTLVVPMDSWSPADGNYTFTATVTVAGDVVAANNTMTAGCSVAGLLDAYTGNTTALTYNGINLTNGTTTGVGTIGTSPFPMAEEYDGTSIYRIYNNLTIGTVGGNGIYTQLGTMTGVSGTPTGIAYNWNTGVMYVVVLNASNNLPQLCTLNMSTYALTLVGTGTEGMIIAMDFADDGYLYGPSLSPDSLYKINPATGATTLIGPTGIDLNYGQDVSYDLEDNKLYTIACGAAPNKFGTYNLTTGAFTEIADKGTDQYATFVITKIPSSTATDILTFGFNALSPAVVGTVDAVNHTVALTVPYGTNVTALVPTITLSAGATVDPLTGVAQNFTTPVIYTVTAQDGITTQAWTVTVAIVVGVSDINASENANIYPIPANDIVNVKMNTTINQIDIININGQVLLQSVINNNEVALNTSKLINGIYFLRIVTSNGVMMKKILIAK